MAASRVLAITELLEAIWVSLPVHEIICSQRVCRRFQSVVESSPALRKVCWYTAHEGRTWEGKDFTPDLWSINPCFERLGLTLKTLPPDYHNAHSSQTADFTLKTLLDETPGSWASMLAFQPPAKCFEIVCEGDYIHEEDMGYYVQAKSDDGIRMGDVMAVLGEAQNRQSWGVDRWAGVRHYSSSIQPAVPSRPCHISVLKKGIAPTIAASMDDNLDLKIVVAQAWDAGFYPAFSLRRLRPSLDHRSLRPSHGTQWLFEMVMHEMKWDGEVYSWDPPYRGERHEAEPMYKDRRYQAKMLRVREYTHGIWKRAKTSTSCF